jgi:hypothetical protein
MRRVIMLRVTWKSIRSSLAGMAPMLIMSGALAMPAALATSDAPVSFERAACPPSVAEVAECHSARDENGAWLLAAIPKKWNHRLIVHAHGGPRLGPPKDGDSAEDLDRFAVMVRAGYAWIGSTYRRGGYGVRMAAEDVDNSRRIFWKQWGKPEWTLLHGQSWGGNVAAKAAELYALDSEGQQNYTAVLTTAGLLFGGTRGYVFRADLRAVYQYYCHNHPQPDEAQYPLWQGLPAGAHMGRDALRKRIDDCTGLDSAPKDRTAQQAARLHDILAVTGVAEKQLASHLAWGTFHFQDMVQLRLDGRNPFDNSKTVYRGSHDDVALNAGVERFTADPQALARLAYDADLSGLIVLPTFNVHAQHDPVVSVQALAAYAKTVDAAGRGWLLAQAITDESDHSRMRDATYLTALHALEDWLQTGVRPDASSLRAACLASENPARDCRFITP